MILSDDPDAAIAEASRATLEALPLEPLRAFLARSDTPAEMRAFFAARGIAPGDVPLSSIETPLLDPDGPTAADAGSADSPLTEAALTEVPAADKPPEHTALSSLSVLERMKLAMKGTREQRAVLVRDSNKLVASAVLSSPKLTETEIEAFTKMGNVTEDVLRTIGMNRSWLKNYGIAAGLCRHTKTPPALAMQLIHRLNERDLRSLQNDRNVREGLRALAKKILSKDKP